MIVRERENLEDLGVVHHRLKDFHAVFQVLKALPNTPRFPIDTAVVCAHTPAQLQSRASTYPNPQRHTRMPLLLARKESLIALKL